MTYSDSKLYGLKSKRLLRYLLKIPSSQYFKQQYITSLIHPYIDNTNGKKRLIEPPEYELKQIQKRLKKFLNQLTIGNNVFSGIKGRSYSDNARWHVGNKYLYKIDLKAFFPSTDREKVYNFFIDKFQVAPDIAECLANITTINIDLVKSESMESINVFFQSKGIKTRNHLISGAPTSQILSYLSNQNMFDEMQSVANENRITMTIYVDDVVFSSPNYISYKFKQKINNTIKKFGFRVSTNKVKMYTKFYPKQVTGVIIDSSGNVALKSSLCLKIISEFNHLKKNPEDTNSRKRLRGLLTAARQINPHVFPAVYAFAFDKNDKNLDNTK